MTNERRNDLTNDLATAARKLYVEQVASAGYLMALKTNGVEITAERVKPYTEALNVRLAQAYTVVGMLLNRRIKAPVRSFDPSKKCDNRCMNATGYECTCACGGTGHGANVFGKRQFKANRAA